MMRAAYQAFLAERKACDVCGDPLHHFEQVHHKDMVLCDSCARANLGPDPYAEVMPKSACVLMVGGAL